MNSSPPGPPATAEPQHAVWIDPDKCMGCVVCLKACPMKAIRVRRGVATILPELCLNCGQCYRVCPHRAVRCHTNNFRELLAFRHKVAAASPALFSQFGYDVTPNQVLLGLKRMGFDEVVDLGWVCEMTSGAMEEYLLDHPALRPGISPVCPAVMRLIARRYPSLLANVLPIWPPRVLASRNFKALLSKRHGWTPEEVGVFHIAPCAAKMVSAEDPIALDQPHVDGVISFRQVYGPLLHALKGLKEDATLQKCSGAGIAWGMSGGQAQGVDVGHTMAVAGFEEVVRILEMLEAGRLNDLSFVEALMCPDGCLGGPLTVENRYRAKSVTLHHIRRYGTLSRVNRAKIRGMLDEGVFEWKGALAAKPLPPLDEDKAQAIAKMKRVQALLAILPGGECGACGSPDCQTFAVDVVLGHAPESDCPFITERHRAQWARSGRSPMTVKDIAEHLGLTVAAGAKGLERPAQGAYISDLLSDVMAGAKPGMLWMTIQTHQNVVAVAVLKELAAVLLLGGRQPADDTRDKAEAEGLPILVSEEHAFELAGKLHALGL